MLKENLSAWRRLREQNGEAVEQRSAIRGPKHHKACEKSNFIWVWHATFSEFRNTATRTHAPPRVPSQKEDIMIEDHWVKELLEDTQDDARNDRLARFDAHLPCLLFELNQRCDGTLCFSFLSQACEDLLGIPGDALYTDAGLLFGAILDEDRTVLLDALQQSASQMKQLNWEGQVRIQAWKDTKWINLRAMPDQRDGHSLRWTGMMTNISQGKRMQEEIRQSRQQLAALAAHIDDVKEQERKRIERDLHDDLGGNLSALKMMLQHVWKTLPPSPYLDDRYAYFENLLNVSIASIHRISADLRPGILDAGLVAALEWLAAEFERQTGLPCEFHCNEADIDMDSKLATMLFRIAQESCNNIRKHAQATGVEMQLFNDGNELQLEIIDNGCGIPDDRRDSPRSFGLRGMQERTAAFGGSFDIVSRQSKGTMVTVRVPMVRPS